MGEGTYKHASGEVYKGQVRTTEISPLLVGHQVK